MQLFSSAAFIQWVWVDQLASREGTDRDEMMAPVLQVPPKLWRERFQETEGLAEGPRVGVACPPRRVNDAKVAQAVAQMLSRAGIDTKVVAMPSATSNRTPSNSSE